MKTKYLLYILLIVAAPLTAQVNDTIYDACMPYALPPLAGVEVVEWVDETGHIYQLDNGSGLMINDTAPMIKTTDTLLYTLKYVDTQNNNIIVNGDFETPITVAQAALISDYTYWPGFCNQGPGNFGISETPANFNAAWYRNISDHTKGDGTGKMFYADGATSDDVVFRQTVTVTKGIEYALVAWLANIHINLQNPHQMDFYINNEKVGELLGEASQEWFRYYGFWTSTVSGDVEVKYINKNHVAAGNDFAIDDIMMAAVKYYNVVVCPLNAAPIVSCNDIEVQIDASKAVHITPEMILKDTVLACGTIDSLVVDHSNFTCNDIGGQIVTLTAWQNGISGSGQATVIIKDDADFCGNETPVPTNLYYDVCNETFIEDNLFDYITDPNGDQLIVDTLPLVAPIYGDFSLQSNGQFVYTPHSTTNELDSVLCRVCDSKGNCAEFYLEFNIDVTGFKVVLNVDSQMCVENGVIHFVLEDKGTALSTYSIDFDTEAELSGFVDVDTALVPADDILIVNAAGVQPNAYNAMLSLTMPHCGQVRFPIYFEILYPQDIMVQKWNNVLTILNASYNGGYDFSDYQWMKNGKELLGEKSAVLYVEENLDFTAEYSVMLTRSNDEVSVLTCPLIPVKRDLDNDAFPQVVEARSAIVVSESQNYSSAKIWTVQGRLVSFQPLSGGQDLIMPDAQGVYLIQLESEDRVNVPKKIVVK